MRALWFVILLHLAVFCNGQMKFSVGFNFSNSYLEAGEYGQMQSTDALNNFFLCPQIGIQYDFKGQSSLRYQKSMHLKFPRFYAEGLYPIYDLRSLDRLNYLYRFKNRNYVTGGLTYLNYKSELYNFPNQDYSGNFGINIGFGKEYKYGFWEVGNLFAFEYSEMTPASLFGYWVVDFGYYIPIKSVNRPKVNPDEKTIFGFGFTAAASYFDDRWLVPSASLLKPFVGVDVHINAINWGTAFFWRRQVGVTFVASGTFNAALQTQWNNLGIRQNFAIKNFQLYGTASYLSGFDAIQTFPNIPTIYEQDYSIRGLTFGLGIPVEQWSFELTADTYLEVPVERIDKGFGWDRIKASVIYNLPIITK